MRFRLSKIALAAGAVAILFSACSSDGKDSQGDRLLVKVHNKTLYLSEMDGMFPEVATPEDSSAIIHAFAQRWIRDALILHEAERNIPSDLNIDKLVRDYRASLLRNNYEQVILEQLMDSTVTQEELLEFYENNKEKYQLETPIARCYLIKLPVQAPKIEEVRRWWNSDKKEDFALLAAHCGEHAEKHLLNDSTWYKVPDIAASLPAGAVSSDNVGTKRDFYQRDSDYHYFFRVFEVKKQQEIAPLSYIEEQARRVILRSRRQELLKKKIEDMYDLALRKSNIETYY
jgi:hypothetical protein